MGQVIKFPTERRKYLTIDKKCGKISTLDRNSDLDRLNRIRLSLKKINALMAELKRMAGEEHGTANVGNRCCRR